MINSIESGKVSLRGALFYELEQYRHTLSHELKVATNDAGSKGYGSIDGVSEGCHIYEQLPGADCALVVLWWCSGADALTVLWWCSDCALVVL